MATDRMERHKDEWDIKQVIRLIDSTPFRRDMVPGVNVAQIALHAHNAHLGIDRAIQSLLRYEEADYEQRHSLPYLFRRLQQVNIGAAEFLENAFDDAVRFYGYNPNRDGFGDLQGLEAYLAATGGEKAYNDMRYVDEVDLHANHPLHQDLNHSASRIAVCIAAADRGFQNPGRFQNVLNCLSDTRLLEHVAISWYNAEDEEQRNKVHSYLDWVKSIRPPYRDIIRDAHSRKLPDGRTSFHRAEAGRRA